MITETRHATEQADLMLSSMREKRNWLFQDMTDEELKDAWLVVMACKHAPYPPTNPAILLRSALTLYQAYGLWPETREAIKEIAKRICYLMEAT